MTPTAGNSRAATLAAGKGRRDDAGCREAATTLLAVGKAAITLAVGMAVTPPGERGRDTAWEIDRVHLRVCTE